MKRVALFVATNLAILVALAALTRLLGLDAWLTGRGIALLPLLGFAAVFGFGGAFLSLALSRWIALRATGARVIEEPRTMTESWLVQTVRRQARQAGIPMPSVAIYEAEGPNAFATGASQRSALIAVSTGLIDRLDRSEVEAVLAHEVAHVANGDMVTMALLQGVLNTFVIAIARVVGFAVDRLVFRTQEGIGPAFLIVSLVTELVLGLLASLLVLAFSRRREFRADAGAAALVGPVPMINALNRIEAASAEPLPATLRAFGIGGGSERLARWFRTHPSIAERVAALSAFPSARLA